MKPLGLSLGMDMNGVPRFQVSNSSGAEDAIWKAVEEAIAAGMTVEQFKSEAAEAWAYSLREQAKHDASEWRKA